MQNYYVQIESDMSSCPVRFRKFLYMHVMIISDLNLVPQWRWLKLLVPLGDMLMTIHLRSTTLYFIREGADLTRIHWAQPQ